MIRRVPIINLSQGRQEVLEGELTDELSDSRTVTIDPQTGREFPLGTKVGSLPRGELVQLPRTTWGNARNSAPLNFPARPARRDTCGS